MNKICNSCSTVNRSISRYCKRCGNQFPADSPEKLDDLIGMDDIKKTVNDLLSVMVAVKNNGLTYSERLHTILIGETGTGKSKLVDILASLFHLHGVTKHDSPIVYDAVDFADFMKNFQDNYKKAKGNILCIENVQKLIPAGYSQTVEQVDRILREMSKQDNKFDPIIILSGQPQGLREYLSANDNVKSKFRYIFKIPEFDSAQLTQLTVEELLKHGFIVPEDAREKLAKIYQHILIQNRKPDYEPEAKNAWLALKIVENIKTKYYLRTTETTPSDRIILPNDIEGDVEKEKTLDQILAEIEAFVGMNSIKKAIKRLIDEVSVQKERAASGVAKNEAIAFHIVLTGNPGTGKTTVARKFGEVFKAIGLLELGHVIEVDRSKMVAQFVGHTAPLVTSVCDKAIGGILFIDEAYTLKQNDNDNFGQEAIDTLLKRMEDDRGKYIVVVAGYPKEITTFLNSNVGLQSRFDERYRYHLDDYTPDELLAIFKRMVAEGNYCLDVDAEGKALKQFCIRCSRKDKNFGNGREARTLFEASRSLHSGRLVSLSKTDCLDTTELTCLRACDIPGQDTKCQDSSTMLAELDSLIGLDAVKKEVHSLINYLQVEKIRSEQGGKTTNLNLHFVFQGNPGTGKTTVARVLSEVFKSMGLLSKGNVVEVDRAGLVASYVGQTAPKTNTVIDSAMGGVLFIDEAYTLAGDTFGKEAIDTLLKRMEDDKGKFIVIAAGYFKEMETFLSANTGLTSRFTKFINFEDYTPAEMTAIFKSMVTNKQMHLDDEAEQNLDILFIGIYASRDKNFANGRTVRNIFENSLQNQSARIMPLVRRGDESPSLINSITWADING